MEAMFLDLKNPYKKWKFVRLILTTHSLYSSSVKRLEALAPAVLAVCSDPYGDPIIHGEVSLQVLLKTYDPLIIDWLRSEKDLCIWTIGVLVSE